MKFIVRVIAMTASTILLVLSSNVFAKAYKGGELYSNQSYQYGRYEIRMRAVKISGVISTFFNYKNGSEVSGTFWEEIDIEVFGKNNATQWQTNIILGNQRPTINAEVVHDAPTSLGDAYHTYVMEWTPNYVAWFLDGVEVRRIIGTSTVTSLTNPQSLRANLWSHTAEGWVGAFDASQLPVYQYINYIEYKAYNAESKKFEGGWRDDFNSFDSARWGKANWTFNENRVDFVPENVQVKSGVLVLALTTEATAGVIGDIPVDETTVGSSASSSVASVASSVAASSVTVSSVGESKAPSRSGGGAMNGLALLFLSICFLFRRRL